jgi:hypothetical protein
MMKLTDGKSSSCLAGNTIHRQKLEKKPKKCIARRAMLHRGKSNGAKILQDASGNILQRESCI